jgi:hypothetical protein
MHVLTVADELRGNGVARQHRPGKPGRPMQQRRHAIEQMRRVRRAGLDGRARVVERRAGVSE